VKTGGKQSLALEEGFYSMNLMAFPGVTNIVAGFVQRPAEFTNLLCGLLYDSSGSHTVCNVEWCDDL
jgi:hypothetical protein